MPQSGPLDAWSHAVANVLVGNLPDAAAIEIGSGRTQLRFTEAALIEHCKTQIARYKCPRDIEFRKDLPKSNVGKILRRELRDEARKAG